MWIKRNLMTLAMFILLSFSCCGFCKEPKSAKNIMDDISAMWLDGDMDRLGVYMEDLRKNFPSYVPARLAIAEWKMYQTGTLEESIRCLSQLKIDMLCEIASFSPLFLSLYEAHLSRLEHVQELFKNHEIQNPNDIHKYARPFGDFEPKWLIEEQLMKLVPQITFTCKTNNKTIVHYVRLPKQRFSLDEAKKLVSLEEVDIFKRTAAIRLVGYEYKNGQDVYLQNLLRNTNIYIVEAAAESISLFGVSIIDELVKLMQEKQFRNSYPDRRVFILWALIRIDAISPKVEAAVKECLNSEDPSAREYAINVIDYIKKLKQ